MSHYITTLKAVMSNYISSYLITYEQFLGYKKTGNYSVVKRTRNPHAILHWKEIMSLDA